MLKGETTMVSDQEIAKGVEALLRQSDHNAVNYTVNGFVQELGAQLGLDLSHKTGFIRDQINHYLRQQYTSQPPPSHPQPSFLTQQQQQQQHVVKDHFAFQHHNHHQYQPVPRQYHYSQFQQQGQQIPHQQQQLPPQFTLRFGEFLSSPPPSVSQQHQQQPPPPTQIQFRAEPAPRQHIRPDGNVAPAGASEKPTKEKESGSAGTKRRGGSGGLNKVCGVSPELQAVVGEPAMPRTEIVKQLWAYIRKNNLQDPSNKRKIICDDTLRALFETDCTDMFKMNKLLSKHITSLASPKSTPAPAKRAKMEAEPAAETPEPTQDVVKEETNQESPVIISDALAAFLGTTSREMLQSEATQQVLEYIRINHLDDLNSMMVICDEKLRELFGAESIPSMGVADMLARRHLFTSTYLRVRDLVADGNADRWMQADQTCNEWEGQADDVGSL